jgi:hypothetical protein
MAKSVPACLEDFAKKLFFICKAARAKGTLPPEEELCVLERGLLDTFLQRVERLEGKLWAKTFRRCWQCDCKTLRPAYSLGLLLCKHIGCPHHKEYRAMFERVYTEGDVARMRRAVALLKKYDFLYFEEGDILSEELVRSRIRDRDREDESMEKMYG